MDYEYFDHTADIGLKAYGNDLPQVFVNAARGMFSVMIETISQPVEEKVLTIKLQTPDENYEQLLVDWLNELLYLVEAEEMILWHFVIKELDGTHLVAEADGGRFDPKHHRYKTEVKSATYHMLEIGRENDKYFGTILLDI